MTNEEYYNKKGYLHLHSTILGEGIYMVKNMQVDVPDKSVLRFDEKEIKYIKRLKKKGELETPESLRVIKMAKSVFGGNLIDPDSKNNQVKRKRAATRTATGKREKYKQPKSWTLKQKARTSV